jgi:hypothetical protein
MREDEFAGASGEVPNWDEVVALDPEEAAAIQVDPDVADFALHIAEFDAEPDEQEDEPDPLDDDPDFDDDAEISLLHDLGIDLDAPDGLPVIGLDFDFDLEPEHEDAAEDEVAA